MSGLLALYGTEEPLPEVRQIRVGRLAFELVSGNLRNIRIDGAEALRAIGYIVRDKDWGTYAPEITDLSILEREDSVRISYKASCLGAGGARLGFTARIEAAAHGALGFEVSALPEQDFLTNRCGFSILHPIVCVSGQPVTIEHVNGSVLRSKWPDLIDPAQPFKEIRAISHQVTETLEATCRKEGDTFEMEDQRNWSDASYKTYVRPLALPWPYVMPAQQANVQKVSLSFAGEPPAFVAKAQAATQITLGAVMGRMPHIGLVITPEEAGETLAQFAHLQEISPQNLLLHFDVRAGHALPQLQALAAVATRFSGEVTLEYVVEGRALAAEFARIAAWVSAAGLRLDAIAVCPSVDRQSTPPGSIWPECLPLAEIYAAARQAFPKLRVGGGMFSYFTELNRKRPPLQQLDFITHATCPIVHAADDVSVMQTLEALPFIERSTRAIIGDMPYRIGPSTIGMRQNPYGSRVMPNPDNKRIAMAEADPRQFGLFNAAWLIGYAASLESVAVLTNAALTGVFGLLQKGERTAAFEAVVWLAQLAGQQRLAVASSQPDKVLGLASARLILLANITSQPQQVDVAGKRHSLAPYAIARIEF